MSAHGQSRVYVREVAAGCDMEILSSFKTGHTSLSGDTEMWTFEFEIARQGHDGQEDIEVSWFSKFYSFFALIDD